MRLIDANKLFEEVGAIKPRNKKHHDNIGEFMNLITNSPTMYKTGEWIKSYITECCGTNENHDLVYRKAPCVKCDQCGEKRRNEEKFCPNCGADMGGGR